MKETQSFYEFSQALFEINLEYVDKINKIKLVMFAMAVFNILSVISPIVCGFMGRVPLGLGVIYSILMGLFFIKCNALSGFINKSFYLTQFVQERNLSGDSENFYHSLHNSQEFIAQATLELESGRASVFDVYLSGGSKILAVLGYLLVTVVGLLATTPLGTMTFVKFFVAIPLGCFVYLHFIKVKIVEKLRTPYVNARIDMMLGKLVF